MRATSDDPILPTVGRPNWNARLEPVALAQLFRKDTFDEVMYPDDMRLLQTFRPDHDELPILMMARRHLPTRVRHSQERPQSDQDLPRRHLSTPELHSSENNTPD